MKAEHDHLPSPVTLPDVKVLPLKGKLKLLVLVDPPMMGAVNVETALTDQQLNFEEATNGQITTSWEYKEFDFASMPWQRYGPYPDGTYAWGPNFAWVRELCEGIQAEHGDKYDFIQLVIDDSHWDRRDITGRIGGYNLGLFFPNSKPDYQVEVIRGKQSWGWISMKRIFDMELVHAFDQMAARIGVNFNTLFDVASFDYDVVHAQDPRYPIYEYRHIYTRTVDTLIKLFPYEGEEDMIVDEAKLNQIFNELLLRDADAGAEGYIGKEESFVRAEVGASAERLKIVRLVSAGREVAPL